MGHIEDNLFQTCRRIMLENPSLFPVIDELKEYIYNSGIEEKEKFLNYQFEYIGLKFICGKLFQDAKIVWMSRNDVEFKRQVEKGIVKSVLIIYTRGILFDGDYEIWSALLQKENLPV